MPAPHPSESLAALGRQWVEAWNSHDLERVLAFYAEDVEMTSPHIPALGFGDGGSLRGKGNLRAYWAKGMTMPIASKLHFTLIDTFASPDSVVVFYENERGGRICEYLRLDDAGKIRQGSANHLER